MRGLSNLLVDAAAMRFSIPKIAMITVSVLAACGPDDTDKPTVPGRWYAEAQVEAGRALYMDYCTVCHGADGSATADWRSPGPDGHYPPPPLNGSAHTWHHPLEVLNNSIENGGSEFGGVMPAFAASLNRDQRLSIVAYIQSWWSNEIYTKWEEIDARSQ